MVLARVEDGRRNAMDTLAIEKCVDLHDLVVDDAERHDRVRPSAHGDYHSRRAVHERGMEHSGRARAETRLARDGCRAVDHRGRCGPPSAEVGAQYDVRVEYRDEGVEVA